MSKNKTATRKLTSRELGTVLAALRTFQEVGCRNSGIEDIATGGGDYEPLSDDEINELCEALNCGDFGGEWVQEGR